MRSAEIYDPSSGRWTTTGSLNQSRDLATAPLLPDGQVLALGGDKDFGKVPLAVEIYNPTTGTWTVSASKSRARRGHTSTRLATGAILIASGLGPDGVTDSADLYVPPP